MSLILTKFMFQRNIFNSSQLILQSFNGKLINNGIRLVTIKVIKPCPVTKEDFDQRNVRLQRVQSPHLSIYKPQLTSMLSISHRIAGCALVGYAAIIGWGSLILPHDFSYYLEMIEDLELSSTTLIFLKISIAYPAAYHFVNGIRHLLWDAGLLLGIKQVYITGYVMLAASIGATVGLALL